MPKSVSFCTLGCKVNQYDSQAMLERFEQSGYEAARPGAEADVYVVNTCTVTGTGDQKSLQMARRFKRLHPRAELVLTGCLAQRMGAKLLDTGARLILGTQNRARVVELLEDAVRRDAQLVAVGPLDEAPYERLRVSAQEGHTRAVMKIQEGCDNRCTYCVIPSVRGHVRSRPLDDVRAEAEALAEAGFQELVLTGVQLTGYGRDLDGRPTLTDAVRAVAAGDKVRRVRLGSLEPRVVTEAFAEAAASLPKLCPQFHLALQSGSDAVLARMKRGYNTEQFARAVERLRAARPEASFTTDVIVGFPGETEEEFAQTVAFCEKIGFLKLHVFPYSRRAGTPAAELPGQLARAVKERRVRALMETGARLSLLFREGLVGKERDVLLEEKTPEGAWTGYTPEYVLVTVADGRQGEIVRARLTGIEGEGMGGIRVE